MCAAPGVPEPRASESPGCTSTACAVWLDSAQAHRGMGTAPNRYGRTRAGATVGGFDIGRRSSSGCWDRSRARTAVGSPGVRVLQCRLGPVAFSRRPSGDPTACVGDCCGPFRAAGPPVVLELWRPSPAVFPTCRVEYCCCYLLAGTPCASHWGVRIGSDTN